MTQHQELLAGRYALGEIIGRGGMADVHRATDRLLDRQVAVKVLRQTTDSGVDRQRFDSEVRLLAGLSHAGLVTVFDAGTTGDQPFLVMELVEGPTLRRLMVDGPMDPDRVAEIGAQLASALAYAHHQGIVHRDVKPGNVLTTTSGRAKLADFGIARVIGDTVRHTQTGTAVGTAAYLAPEQVRGNEVTEAADVYSLGLVLLEALTAERAYPGGATESALARLERRPSVPATVPPAWRRLLTSMTDTDPARRPDATAVATELELPRTAPVDVSSTVLRPAAKPRPFWMRGLPAHARTASAAVAALALLMVVVAFASGGSPGSADPPNDPTTSTPTVAPSAPVSAPASPIARTPTPTASTPTAESSPSSRPGPTSEPPDAQDRTKKPGKDKKDKPVKDKKGKKGKKGKKNKP